MNVCRLRQRIPPEVDPECPDECCKLHDASELHLGVNRTMSVYPDKPATGSQLSGILLLVTGLTFAALAGAVMKALAEDLPIALIVWCRFAGFFLLVLPIAAYRFGPKVVNPSPLWLQLLRGSLLPLSTAFFILGARSMNYAEAIAVLYVYPFIITLIGPWLLGEPSRLASWIGVCGGFIGILLIAQPSAEGLRDPGAFWILLCGVVVALQMILNRRLGRDIDPWLTSTWGAGTAALLLSPLLPYAWTSLDLMQILLLLLLCTLAAISQTLFAIAFARSPAAELAPFTYSEIIAAVGIGLLVFGTLPSLTSWIGICIIIVSGILVARSQSRR